MTYPDSLTPREMEVVSKVMQQLPEKIIASEMHITLNTVKSFMRSIHSKTGTHSYAEMIAYGYSIGFSFDGSYRPKGRAA